MVNAGRWLYSVLIHKPRNLGYNPPGQTKTIQNAVRWPWSILYINLRPSSEWKWFQLEIEITCSEIWISVFTLYLKLRIAQKLFHRSTVWNYFDSLDFSVSNQIKIACGRIAINWSLLLFVLAKSHYKIDTIR